jgi:UDP-N-acetylmuramate dehydrogenase
VNPIKNASLKKYNTFGFDAQCSHLIEITNETDLLELYAEGFFENPFRVIGGGSNILLTRNYSGAIILNRLMGQWMETDDEEFIEMSFGAGENWHQTVQHCVKHNWGGIENLSLIPGCVGASPIQNIGAYGEEVKDRIVTVRVFDTTSGEFVILSNEDCRFGYRDSIFKHPEYKNLIVTSVTFRLSKVNHELKLNYGDIQTELAKQGITDPKISDISNAVIAIRRSKLPDPAVLGNSGSFFKNPVVDMDTFKAAQAKYPEIKYFPIDDSQVKVAAGWLIETAGWKGFKKGHVGVHEKQALVLVHFGGGKGEEISSLAREIQSDIHEKFGIVLEFEVNIW